MSRTYDLWMETDYLNKEFGCCDCGYRRGEAGHPGIRCPATGRCGECGNDWPCEDHAKDVPERLKKKINQKSYVRPS